ncbi:hypothetical protein DM785_02285 [Deinococcus actinosclerus]|nr:hypothetical protein DM785_02285 [Deinococcus actinosclerus]
MKTDPRTETISAVGPLTYTLPALYGGWTVTGVTGGAVTRAGLALLPGAGLTAGDVLTFTPAASGGTTSLAVQQAGAEFSGRYADLTGAPDGSAGGGYSETVLFGPPLPPLPSGDAIPTRGLEFVAGTPGTVNAVRFWARLEAASTRPTWELNAELIVNDQFKSSVPVTLTRGRWTQVTALLTTPVPIETGDRIGVVLQSPQEVPELLGTYIEAGDDSYALGYAALNGYIDNLSVTEPITYVRTPDGDTGGTYPAAQLLTTTGTPPSLPHAPYPTLTGTGGAWALVDSRPGDGGLPAVQALYDGRIYRAPLWPDAPSGNDPHGLYLPQVAAGTTLPPRRLAWRGGQVIATDASGAETVLSGAGGGGLDTEAVQDIVAAMLGTAGTYNDAAGTYTITLPAPRTDEEIQDVVAALIQAGAGVTKTYDDAGNVLTLSASGGTGSGGVTSVAGRTGAVTLTTADLPDLTEVVQDTVAALIQAGAGVTKTYDDAAGTLTLTVTGGGGAAGAYSSSNPVPLATTGTPDFLPADRIVDATAGNYRMVGPVVTAPTGAALTYTSVRVPLRNLAAGSVHIGHTAYLMQVRQDTGVVVARTAFTLTQGATEAVLAGPYTVPAGQAHAFLVGGGGGAWNADTEVFYGAQTAFAAPNAAVPCARTDTDPETVAVGGAFAASAVLSAHRTVLLYGSNIAKGTTGPAFTVGPTANRPAANVVQAGDQHYDTTLGRPVWWSGSAWRDAAGTSA